MSTETQLTPVKIEDEMRTAYLDYAMSVIVARALPDIRDGLKPVQRRILYALNDLGLRHTGTHKKSARIVGEVLGKYHPHGDAAVYDAMVRMAQDFSLRYPLIDGQGNFGSVDNDPAAAMRYTEARLSRIAEEMLADIDKETVNFSPNFDASIKEPTVLPAKLPNLLVNGGSGIAVGMATSIPPHNLGEIANAIIYLVENPEATVDDLTALVPGPDFPTGGVIRGIEGIKNAYASGHGRVTVQARWHSEEGARGDRGRIVVTELPYQTNKAMLVERIAELARTKKIDGISEVRDESDREGMRIVVELRRADQTEQVVNSLFQYTAIQSYFFVNMVALIDGQPKVISLKEALWQYIVFRRQVITRRSQFELTKAKDRAHILEGFKIALDHLDEVINTIRRSQSAETARTNLMKRFGLSQAQAQAVLDMQLRRLAALERQKINDEYAEVLKTIAYLEDLLANPKKIDYLIREEAEELKAKYSNPRRTEIREEEPHVFSVEDLVPHQQMVVTLSRRGYIKRLPSDTYRSQHRGGRGITGMATREADAVRHLVIADTHHSLLFFTNRGKAYHLKCHDLPRESTRTSRGLPIINLVSMDVQERVTAVVTVDKFAPLQFLVFATRHGEVKKTRLSDFASVRASGLITMDLEKNDELVATTLAKDKDEVILVTRAGKGIKFAVAELRTASRTSGGVKGIRLAKDDEVVGMGIVSPETFLLTITAFGYGKRTSLATFPRHHRGSGGVRAHELAAKTGEVVAAKVVKPPEELMIVSANGIVMRTAVEEIAVQGRDAQGVKVMGTEQNDRVASIACCAQE